MSNPAAAATRAVPGTSRNRERRRMGCVRVGEASSLLKKARRWLEQVLAPISMPRCEQGFAEKRSRFRSQTDADAAPQEVFNRLAPHRNRAPHPGV